MGRVTERRRVVRIRNGGAGVRPDTPVGGEARGRQPNHQTMTPPT
ncbi:sulfurtransferase FdhD, partial [Streptomyces nojiriensis]